MSIFIHNNGSMAPELHGNYENEKMLKGIILENDFVNFETETVESTTTYSQALQLIKAGDACRNSRTQGYQARICKINDKTSVLFWVDGDYVVRYRVVTINDSGTYSFGTTYTLSYAARAMGLDVQLIRDKNENNSETVLALLMQTDGSNSYVLFYRYNDNQSLTYISKTSVYDPGVIIYGMSLNRIQEDKVLVNICSCDDLHFQIVTYNGSSGSASSVFTHGFSTHSATRDVTMTAITSRYGDGQICSAVSGYYDDDGTEVTESYLVWFTLSSTNQIKWQDSEYFEAGKTDERTPIPLIYLGYGRWMVTMSFDDKTAYHSAFFGYDNGKMYTQEASNYTSSFPKNIVLFQSDLGGNVGMVRSRKATRDGVEKHIITIQSFSNVNKSGSMSLDSDTEYEIICNVGDVRQIGAYDMDAIMLRNNLVLWMGNFRTNDGDNSVPYIMIIPVKNRMFTTSYTTTSTKTGIVKAISAIVSGIAQESGENTDTIKILKK